MVFVIFGLYDDVKAVAHQQLHAHPKKIFANGNKMIRHKGRWLCRNSDDCILHEKKITISRLTKLEVSPHFLGRDLMVLRFEIRHFESVEKCNLKDLTWK